MKNVASSSFLFLKPNTQRLNHQKPVKPEHLVNEVQGDGYIRVSCTARPQVSRYRCTCIAKLIDSFLNINQNFLREVAHLPAVGCRMLQVDAFIKLTDKVLPLIAVDNLKGDEL